jgi:hypothetical protein
MRFRYSFLVLAVASLSAPAFAQNDVPAGEWDGTIERNGARTPIVLHLSEQSDVWSGRLQIDGASAPLDSVRVADDNIHFDIPGRGAFDGTFSRTSMTGSVSGPGALGSFMLTLEESRNEDPAGYLDPIGSQGP